MDEVQSCARMRILPLAVAELALAQHQESRPTALHTAPEVLSLWYAKNDLLRAQVNYLLVVYAVKLCPICVGYGTLRAFHGHHDKCGVCRGTGSRTPPSH